MLFFCVMPRRERDWPFYIDGLVGAAAEVKATTTP